MSLRDRSLPHLILAGVMLCFGLASAAFAVSFGWGKFCIDGNECLFDSNSRSLAFGLWASVVLFGSVCFAGACLALRQSRVAWIIGLLLLAVLGAVAAFLYWLSHQRWG